jgi:hypothetical protein
MTLPALVEACVGLQCAFVGFVCAKTIRLQVPLRCFRAKHSVAAGLVRLSPWVGL